MKKADHRIKEMMKRRKNGYPQLLSGIVPLADELARVKKQAAALGVFTNDRELLKCSKCGLTEDVLTDGMLVTYHMNSRDSNDSGLRFEKIAEEKFRCPVCGTILKAVVL